MERKFTLLLLLISFALTNVVAYLDEGIRNFEYLTQLGDWIALIMYTVGFLILPLLIFLLLKKGDRKRFSYSLLGFAPMIMLIIVQLS